MNIKPYRGWIVLAGVMWLAGVIASTAGNFELISVRDGSLAPSITANGDSSGPILSGNGRYVAFSSLADNLVPGVPAAVSNSLPRWVNAYLRDLTNGTTALVSVNMTGQGGNGDSRPVGVSSNGRYVLFESDAGDLVANDTNGVSDVFLRDTVNGTTRLVSADNAGVCGKGASFHAVMTPDAQWVAFASVASNLVAGDANGIQDVFARNIPANATVLVSVGAKATNSVSATLSLSDYPEISAFGPYIAFYSTATNLVPGLRRSGEVYVRDLVGGTTTWASTNAWVLYQAVTGQTNVASCNYKISSDGRYVAFEVCTNKTLGDIGRGMILRYDMQTALTTTVNANAEVPQGAFFFEQIHNLDMTADGRYIVFVGRTNKGTCVLRWDGQTGDTLLVNPEAGGNTPTNAYCNWPTVDASGRYVAYLMSPTNRPSGATVPEYHLYVADTLLGTNRLVDVDLNGTGVEVDPSAVPSLSSDGQSVAFECQKPGLVLNDRNGASDVFVRRPVEAQTELVSVRDAGMASLTPDASSGFSSASMSGDGRYVVFTSEAGDLVPNDTNGLRDVYVRDRWLAANILVSVATNGMAADGMSYEPVISGDGRYVVFTSWATNCVPVGTNKTQVLLLRDLQAGTTTLLSQGYSAPGSGASSANGTFGPRISMDGRYVLWQRDTNSSFQELVLRDQQTGVNRVLFTKGNLVSYAMSADGSFVGFTASAPAPTRAYVWSLQAGSLIYTNQLGNSPVTVALSADGRRLAYLDSTFGIYETDLVANTNWQVTSQASPSSRLFLSADGRFLAYEGNNAGIPTVPSSSFLYDSQMATNILLAQNVQPVGSPVISLNGRYVAYRTYATNGVPNDSNDVPDVVLYDRFSQSQIQISLSVSNNNTANQRSWGPVFSTDGKTLLIRSWASDLAVGDFNRGSDVFALSLAALINPDLDNDGMDDQWEMDHFNTMDGDGTADLDGDGVNDLYEYLAGTDPNDANVFLKAQLALPGPTISWQATPWKSYRVQYKDNLSDPVWLDLDGVMPLNGNMRSIDDPSPHPVKRYYRVKLDY